MKKLIPAICMLLIAAAMLGTSTFAWFSMNTKVTATGMMVRAKVSNNLLIASSTTDASSKASDADFKSVNLSGISATLEPVSSTDGLNFFWTSTKNVNATGNATNEIYTKLTGATDSAFTANYDVSDAVGYVDYAFQVKANNAGETTGYVNLTNLTMTYGAATDTQKAFRAALFVQDSDATMGALTAANLVTILRPSGATYFGTAASVNADLAVKAASSESAPLTEADIFGAVTSIDQPALIGEVPAGSEKVFKGVLRLWLEGEDTTCKNTTFASLTADWAVDLAIEFQNATTGATAVLDQAVATASHLSNGLASAAEASFTVDNEPYYKLGTTNYYVKTASKTIFFNSTDRIYGFASDDTAHQYPLDMTNQLLPLAPTFTISVNGTKPAQGDVTTGESYGLVYSGGTANAALTYAWKTADGSAASGTGADSASFTAANDSGTVSYYCEVTVTTAAGSETFKTSVIKLTGATTTP